MTEPSPTVKAAIARTSPWKLAKLKFIAWADVHLVPHWRHFYKFISIQAMTLQGALLVGWAQLPQEMKDTLSWLLPVISGFILAIGVLGAVTKQSNVPTVEKPE